MYRRHLAERLTYEREAKSLSREHLALLSGVSSKTIKRLEEEAVDNPRPVTIRKLAEALEIDPARLRPPEEVEANQLQRIERKLGLIMTVLGIEDLKDLAEDAEAAADAARSEMPPPRGRSSRRRGARKRGERDL